MYNVLIFPAGEMNSAELHAALSQQVNVQLFGASSVERLGHHLFQHYRGGLPLINDPNFLIAFNDLISEWSIDLIIPTHDSVVQYLGEIRDLLHARVLVPERETAELCRDKRLTYLKFEDQAFTPKMYREQEEINYPVFVKPAKGQGAVGARVVKDRGHSIDWESEVVCEYLPGYELTIDCFTDRNGNLLGVFPRSRDRTLGGISIAGRALDASDEVMTIATCLNDRMRFLGMWYFQAKADNSGRLRLLEVSARCAGSQCLTRARGVNLPLLSVYTALGRDVTVSSNKYTVKMERVLANRYDVGFDYDVVYLDFDDTVASATEVNPDIMRLIYQFKNEKKSVRMITRHASSIFETLDRLCIARNLFDEVIHIADGSSKADYINPVGAIFIDNAFSERLAVLDKHGIPVLDVDTTEILQHWKR